MSDTMKTKDAYASKKLIIYTMSVQTAMESNWVVVQMC